MKKAILFQGLFTLSLFILFGSQCFALTSEEKDIYSSTVERVLHEPYGEYATYAQVDLNNDEVSELIVSHLSDDEISTIDEVFTISDGSCISAGSFYGPNSYFESESGEGILAIHSFQGFGEKSEVRMYDNTVFTSSVSEGGLVDWSVYKNDNPIFQNKLVNYYDEQIIPDSDGRFLSEQDIEFLNDTGLELAKNEIYARHGRVFLTPYINKYFMEQSWYSPTVYPEEFSDSVFNEYEAKNITLFVNEEEKRRR